MQYATRGRKRHSVVRLVVAGRFMAYAALACLLSLFANCGPGEDTSHDQTAATTSATGGTSSASRTETEPPATEAEPAEPEQSTGSSPSMTTSRDDLERFQGVYGNENGPNANRNFFVYATCDGQLGVGAMWGDVAPWILAATGDTSFKETHSNPYNPPLEANFRIDGDGNGVEVSLNSHFKDRGWMKRLGDLPDGWAPDCEH